MEKSLELVRQLVNDFSEHEKAYLAPTYQESQVRQDFIDKFFTVLGWDVSHQRQKNPYEQEVKIENKVSTQGSQRRADYAFFIAPNFRDVKFFVEAKKPAHDLANANYYYQTVRYGWNKTTPIAVLTDFEEFHILDCRFKPNIKTVLDHKIESFHYSQYTDEEIFKKIFYLFGRDAVAGGSLENFVQTLSKPRGKGKGIIRGKYQQVDEAFLELLDGYRDTLAHAFKNKNPHLDGESLTEAVQRTLDRLVFIRFLEDKGIEEQAISQLSNLAKVSNLRKVQLWEKFLALCRSMEPKYNGLVFKPHPVIDSQTFVAPDDKTFGEICGEISDPTSPYDFNTIPISILGSIYERFLGKIVTTTEKRAKVIEKPEVRKAGGVYYTPEYIVRYIVNETVGKLLYEKQGIGIGDEGLGFSNRNIEGENYGVTNVQGAGGVEAGDVISGRNLQADDIASQGGTIRTEEPNATSGGLNSGEHSGGVRTGESEGIPSVPVLLTGIIDGIGNTFGDSSAGYSAEAGTNIVGNIADGRSGQDANASNSIPQNPLNPNPYTLKFKLTPTEVAKLKIIDIACGSGSFLLEVYSQLLDYHTRYYNEFPEKAKKGDTETREGKIVLSHKKRQEILVNNIYGVDIDFQATEVTQLSLYLKLMEDVTMNDAYQFSLLKERMLPDLRRNIVCGNSLIGRDILEGKLFDDETERTLKPMNFEDVFPEIMTPSVLRTSPTSQELVLSGAKEGEKEGVEKKASSGGGPVRRSSKSIWNEGGFDVVVGNPPYVFGRDWKSLGIPENVKKYFSAKYSWSPYQLDMFSIFMERSFNVYKLGGRIGQIVPNVWLNNTYSKITRSSLLKNAGDLIIAVPPKNVFQGITVDTVVYTYEKRNKAGERIRIKEIDFTSLRNKTETKSTEYLSGERPISTAFKAREIDFIYRMKTQNKPLSDFAEITRGVHSYRIGRYGKSAFGKGYQTKRDIEERPYHSITKKEGYRHFIYGKNLGRYSPLVATEYINYGDWLAEPRQAKYFEGERIYSRKILGERLVITVALDNNVADQQVYITKPKTEYPKVNYLAGILGSKLLSFFIRTYYNETTDSFPQIKVGQLQALPICTINFEDAEDKARHDNIVKLVEQMLAAKAKHAAATTESEKNRLDIQIETLDRQIDNAVYELYGLSEEEIKIVEGK